MTTYIPEIAPGEVTIVENVDCVFGKDHTITVRIDKDKHIKYLGCDCYPDKDEVEGMIALGTDEKKTCLGTMRAFIRHVNNQKDKNGYQTNYYGMSRENPVYGNSVLYLIATTLESAISKKKRDRGDLKAELESYKEKESVVCRQLRNVITREVGPVNTCFELRHTDADLYTFNLRHAAHTTYDYNLRKSVTKFRGSVPVATRIKGVWQVEADWKALLKDSYQTRECLYCGLTGHNNHNSTKGHARKSAAAMFIALQCTSREGLRLRKDNVVDKKGEPVKFKYRAGSKTLVGVEIKEF